MAEAMLGVHHPGTTANAHTDYWGWFKEQSYPLEYYDGTAGGDSIRCETEIRQVGGHPVPTGELLPAAYAYVTGNVSRVSTPEINTTNRTVTITNVSTFDLGFWIYQFQSKDIDTASMECSVLGVSNMHAESPYRTDGWYTIWYGHEKETWPIFVGMEPGDTVVFTCSVIAQSAVSESVAVFEEIAHTDIQQTFVDSSGPPPPEPEPRDPDQDILALRLRARDDFGPRIIVSTSQQASIRIRAGGNTYV